MTHAVTMAPEVPPARVAEAPADPLFLERWSPRSFRDEAVPPEAVRALFEAARWAPSSRNDQPWLFLYAKEPADRERFASVLLEGNRAWASRAPLLALLLARRTHRRDGTANAMAHFDAGAAWLSLALQARLLGLDAHAMGGIDRERAHDLLRIPRDEYDVLIAIAVGRRGDAAALPPALSARERPSARLPLTEIVREGGFAAIPAGAPRAADAPHRSTTTAPPRTHAG